MPGVEDAIAIWKAGVAAVEPRQRVVDSLHDTLRYFYAKRPDAKILVVGGGKAGAAMARGVEDSLIDCLHRVEGIVNIPEGAIYECQKIRLNEARPVGVNLPTESAAAAVQQMIEMFQSADASDIGICLISGGGSALLPLPVHGISLADKIKTTRMLHASGASIESMNIVRKHLSGIKGGRLAEAFRGDCLFTYIVSDVINDPLDVIASGPTCADPSTYDDALEIISNYNLLNDIPIAVLNYLHAGSRGEHEETPKTINIIHQNNVIASNEHAMHALFRKSESLGYQVMNFGSQMDGEASFQGLLHAGVIQRWDDDKPAAIIFGGETTVTLGPNPGKGGRNQEFVLAMLCELGVEGMAGVTILSGGTDGEDGPTDAAGAIGTQETLLRAKSLNLDPHDYLRRHDAYPFFEATGGLFKTGLTGTNVMDIGVILLS